MFIQLIHQLKDDSQAITLFTDLVSRLEKSISLSRDNEVSLGGENISFNYGIVTITSILFMSNVVPETITFVVETVVEDFL